MQNKVKTNYIREFVLTESGSHDRLIAYVKRGKDITLNREYTPTDASIGRLNEYMKDNHVKVTLEAYKNRESYAWIFLKGA